MATTVLLVDDQPDILEITAYMLEDAGYDVICAKDSDEAKQRAREQASRQREIGVVVTDLHLPHGGNGIEMGVDMRRNGLLTCPWLIVSGSVEPWQISQHDWMSYLPKPFAREALLQKIIALACDH